MNKLEVRRVLNGLTEQHAPASTIDLWPALQTRVQAASTHQKSLSRHRWLKPAFILAVLLGVLTIFLSLPPGSSVAQQIIHLFSRTYTNTMPLSSKAPAVTGGGTVFSSTTPYTNKDKAVFEEECGSYRYAHCSIDEIRSLVDFPVFALPEEPENLHFKGATGGPDSLTLFYGDHPVYGHIWITEQPSSSADQPLAVIVGADADIQQVMIDEVSAEYVAGGYVGVPGSAPVWDSYKPTRTLRWVDHDVLITLVHDCGWPDFSRYELVKLATSLTNEPVGESGIPAVDRRANNVTVSDDVRARFPLTLAEAEELAGFKLLTPTGLPTPSYFIGARYDQATKIVSSYYYYIDPSLVGNYIVAVVSQELIASEEECELCGFVRGEFYLNAPSNLIGIDAKLDIVQVGDYQGLYVDEGWRNWQWRYDALQKRLRFQTETIAVEVTAIQLDWSKSDVVDFAASLK